jgi:hypothetical protein
MTRLSPARDVRRDSVGARSRRRALPVSEFVQWPGGSSALRSSVRSGIAEERRNHSVVEEFEHDDETPCSPRRSGRYQLMQGPHSSEALGGQA